MQLIQSIRSNSTINSVTRLILNTSIKYLSNISKRWHVAGNIPLTINGIKFSMYSNCDDHKLNALYYNYAYIEKNDLLVFSSLLRDDDVVLDLGANTGIYTVLSSLSAKNVTVHSFEPHPQNLERLKRNISLNDLKKVTIVEKCVGNEQGKVKFSIPETNGISDTSSVSEDFSKGSYDDKIQWKKIEVEQTSLDSYIDRNNVHKINAIKIDVEGQELNVLKGARLLIAKFKPMILIECFINAENRQALKDFVVDNNYFVYVIVSEGLVLIDRNFTTYQGLNYLFLHDKMNSSFTTMKQLRELNQSNFPN
ncbi:MAG: FkbM family methyltransferase [Bacteroidia bacterium]|nr:FkbM family methyltransferase [Bacteroidia bacterium]